MDEEPKRKTEKVRLDRALVELGMAASRERAQALVLAGKVLVAEQKVTKPGTPVALDAPFRLLGADLKFVSRGGLKLEGALDAWLIEPEGRYALDVGASTGGFTDCLLQRGAAGVLAVDTGYGQIAHRLRVDTRVRLMERTNARLLEAGSLAAASAGPVSLLVMDVSFISATLVLPAVVGALGSAGGLWRGEAVILVKPQFEAGREYVGKGGIVRDPAAQRIAVDRVRGSVAACGGRVFDVRESPITGMEGNREFLLWAQWE